MTFVRSLTIPDLGPGAGFALWAFRAAAIGHIGCCALRRGYDEAFGPEAERALAAIDRLARAIGNEGGRVITLSHPGCGRVTADELSLTAALAAAQAGDIDKRNAHLNWLMCARTEKEARLIADEIGALFMTAGLSISAPPVELYQATTERCFTVHHRAGRG